MALGTASSCQSPVIAHCLYGVDKNPMAVELCKVALWIEGHAPGRPLTFLDHRIRCGDSLVGVFDLAVLGTGIPAEAYTPVGGDDKALARSLARRNRSNQIEIDFGRPGRAAAASAEACTLFDLPDDTPAVVREKAKLYQDLRAEGTPLWRDITACHLWTAPFFARLTADSRVPLTEDLKAFLQGTADEALVREAWRLARQHRFFHWPLEFPEVFAGGGFDVVLCNPPWERTKLQDREFFAGRDAELAFALNRAARQHLIRRLPQTNPLLWEEYVTARHAADALGKYLRDSGRYPLTARRDINTYSVFAELFVRLLSPRGRGGVVVPTGIATDETNRLFFAELVQDRRLVSLYDFENREGMFPAVHRQYRFCLLTVKGSAGSRGPARFAFFLTRTEQMRDRARVLEMTGEDFALFNPTSKTTPVFRTVEDLEVARRIYSRLPVLSRMSGPDTPQGPLHVRLFRMLDMANSSHLFRTTEDLEADGYVLVRGRDLGGPDGPRFVRGDDIWVPLYEAKMVWQFDHRFGSYEGLPPDTSSTHLPTPSEEEYANPDYFVLPRYWVSEEEVATRITQVPPAIVEQYQRLRDDDSSPEYPHLYRVLAGSLLLWVAGYHLSRGQKPGPELVERVGHGTGPAWRQGLSQALHRGTSMAAVWQERYPLTDDDVETIRVYAARDDALGAAQALIYRRRPTWLLGFRDVTNATNERTAIFSALPAVGVGHSISLMAFEGSRLHSLTLLGALNSLIHDYVTRQKVAGTHLSFFYFDQLPTLPPGAYSQVDLWFLVPRLLELVYTAWDLEGLGREVWRESPPELRLEVARRWQECTRAEAPRLEPDGETLPPFRWDSRRRAVIRAEVDAYYARLYGLDRDELRYILDPKEVFGEDYPGETFRVLKENETRLYGEYRTGRMVLEAWDRLETGGLAAEESLVSEERSDYRAGGERR